MSAPWIQTAFAAGEISPSLFGHVDLAKFSIATATMRNCFVSYRGGAYSRAGTSFVGFSKQTGRSYPPRLISFQFSINQGLALEFGNEYMRVISNGAFITENTLAVTNITQANPAVVTVSASGGLSASANNGSVVSSYAPGDLITLAGGTYTSPTVLAVTNTVLLALDLNSPGVGNYAPTDTIHLTGGTQTTPAVLTVQTTKVVSATIAAAGSGGTAGTQTVTGTTGTGTKFQASVTVAGGAITAILSISLSGSYTVNPTVPAMEPVTGASLSGAKLDIVLGVNTFTISNGGVFTANPSGLTFTQASSSGSGTGATFQFAVLGPNAVTVSSAGVYSSYPANPVAQASTTGSGLGVNFTVAHTTVTPFVNGDWVYLSDIVGMTQLNGRTLVVANASGTTFELADVYGNLINSTAYSAYISGGTAARIYTLATPYGEADLEYLKFTQSADVMSLTCWNQLTETSYPTYDLERLADNNWELNEVTFAEVITPPASCTAVATVPSGTTDAEYAYVISALDAAGNESVASPVGACISVDIAAEQGSIQISWSAVPGAQTYNIYKAPPAVDSSIPAGSLYGYAGTSYGATFVDSNIVEDLTQVPPTHQNPFAPGAITGVTIISGGAAIVGLGYTVNTSSGSGFLGYPIYDPTGTILAGFVVADSGSGYAPTDTITFTVGSGTAPTGVLTISPASGAYPSTVTYFQQRRVYAGSPNNPDTYWMSQPGAFTNFDSRIPTIADDAITGSPWSLQVNGIQFMVPMPGGLVVLTGRQAWQLTGAGGSSLNPQPITPANQQAQPQAYNGCSATVPPVNIDYDILYVQAKGSIVRDLAYNFFVNIYTGADLTQLSSHLFTGFTIREWAWCEEPYKVLWAVRDDGVLLSDTYLKPQDVNGWARHDTNGLFQSVCSVTEPPVDALYLATQRFPGTNTAYMIERMDNRIWADVESTWCVDAGLSLPMPTPSAALSASSATGLGAISGFTDLAGGQNYSALTTAMVVDNNGNGPGTGCVIAPVIAAGAITGFTISAEGQGYINPALVITDPANTGSGASVHLTLDNSATFTASSPIFNSSVVGDVIRMGGGIAIVTVFVDDQHVTADIMSPIVEVIPNSGGRVEQQASGSWTLTTPTDTVTGLEHLAGMTVTGLYDGNVIPPALVPATGIITLPAAASAVVVGLGFQAQTQSVYLNVGQSTLQGQRKKISDVTARIESSRGLKMGANQIDGSTLSPMQIAPQWNNLKDVPDSVPTPNGATPPQPYNSNFAPLYTGDRRIPLTGGFDKPGQVCLQQDNPLPMNIIALVIEALPGDTSQTEAPRQQQNGQQRQAA